MRVNNVLDLWRRGSYAVNAWISSASPYAAEVMGHQGFDSVTVDLQHGMIGFSQAIGMLQAISATPAVPMARVLQNDAGLIMQLLDAGAYGIICPMISTAEDAERFVSACRYPPRGTRSFGPARGLLFGGADYLAGANQAIMTLAMIETRQGLDNLEEILSVEGLDGIYVGPNDLALALGFEPRAESQEKAVAEAVTRICETTRQHGKLPGIFCSTGEAAAIRARQGFALVTPGNDVSTLSRAAKDAVAAARPAQSSGTSKSGG